MNNLNLDSFGEIIENLLKDNEVHMLLTLPKGTLEAQVQDNTGLGSVVQFYILLNSIGTVGAAMQKDMGIDCKSPEWEKVVNTLLVMVKNEIIGGAENG